MRTKRSRLARQAVCLALFLCAFDAPARLIPTAPVNAWPVLPAVQKRSARQVVVLELVSYGAACLYCVPTLMRVAIHDSQGIQAPRYVTPGGTPALITNAAAFEGPDKTLRILIYGFVDAAGRAAPDGNFLYSQDSGVTWVAVAALAGLQSRQYRPSAVGMWELGWTIWSRGQPAPSAHDAVLLNTYGLASLVHLDVDAAAFGAPIVIDPGSPQDIARPSGGPIPPTAPNDFPTQTLVRASLRQQLVIPAVARAAGRGGSNWRTDLILRNPGASDLRVTARLLANPLTTSQPAHASLTLSPGTLTVVPDVLDSIFHLEQASGALLLIPDATGTIQATSRTYTASGNGAYGMAVDAEDVVAGVGPGLEQTFAAGLLGAGFRSNFVGSDLSGQGSELQLFPQTGGTIGGPLSISAPPIGQSQLDDLAALTGGAATSSAAFRATSSSGSVMAGLIAIDDATNDPTWVGPDTPAGSLIIPAIVHVRGANGADYRTDLFLFNPDPVARDLFLNATLWNQPENRLTVRVTLAAGESRRVPDALFSLFGRSGVAVMSLQTGFPTGGVLVTSRTFTVREDGATYGTVLPPLRTSQTATPGETLEILGPTGAPSLRTNLALVQLSTYLDGPPDVHVQILDERGDVLDSFDQSVPAGNGLQMNDLFRARGLGDGPKAALIRLTPSSGILAAYATTIDSATNDPVYFAGNLAP
jgi:hypothetical protein